MGTRSNDAAKTGMIEILGNEYEELERNRNEVEKEAYEIETFWQWEASVCEQEVDYYEQLLRDLKTTIDQEIAERLSQAGIEDIESNIPKKQMTAEQKQARNIISSVEDKYADKKRTLVMGYERAKTEELVHYKQKDFRKYERLFNAYAYPINSMKFEEQDRVNIIAVAGASESDEVAMSKI